jgi:hypothetical protein
MNPKKLGSIDNLGQEWWKAPLPRFIEDLYLRRFGRERPRERGAGGGSGAEQGSRSSAGSRRSRPRRPGDRW